MPQPTQSNICRQFWNHSARAGETPALPGLPSTRRQFLKQSALLAGSLLSGSEMLASQSTSDFPQTPSQKIIFGTPLTHCDWMLKDNLPGVKWGNRRRAPHAFDLQGGRHGPGL